MSKFVTVVMLVVVFVSGLLFGAAVGAAVQYRLLEHHGQTEAVGTMGLRLHTAELLRLERPAEALEFHERLLLVSLPYLMHRYPEAGQLPGDALRMASALRRYHESYPLAAITPEMEQWLVTVPLQELSSACPAPLMELLSKP